MEQALVRIYRDLRTTDQNGKQTAKQQRIPKSQCSSLEDFSNSHNLDENLESSPRISVGPQK